MWKPNFVCENLILYSYYLILYVSFTLLTFIGTAGFLAA